MANLMRVRTVFTYGAGSPGLMTNYFGRSAGAADAAAAQVAVDRVRDALATSPTLWPTTMTWSISGDVDVIEDSTGEIQDQLAATPRTGAGTSTFALGPLPVGVLLKSRTDAYVDGRRLTGRTYFVPINSGSSTTASPNAGLMTAVTAIGTALLNAGLTNVEPYVWSRPREATEVGPGRPAGPARAARAGSSAEAVSFSCSPKYVVLTSRRD